MTTIADAATKGLDVTTARGLVRVKDGVDTWLCTESGWNAAVESLGARDADDSDEGGAEAYTALCSAVASPVASVVGSSRGEWRTLVRRAVDAGLVDPDDATRMYGVSIA